MGPHHRAVSYQPLLSHHLQLGFAAAIPAHVHAGHHPTFELGAVPDLAGQAPGLVRGQGVHGVEQQGLDARLGGMAQAVIQDGIEETLGLARPGAGGDQGGLGLVLPVGVQSIKSPCLMRVGQKGGGDIQG